MGRLKHFSTVILAWCVFAMPIPAQEVLFASGFEAVSDFDGFYITRHDDQSHAFQELSAIDPAAGKFAHRAWITRANPPSGMFTNRNHRAYPTVQFQKTPAGVLPTPLCVGLSVWADFDLRSASQGHEDQWISLATFTDDQSDSWRRTVLVNVSYDGFIHLQHVPRQGQQAHIFQSTTVQFPYRQWVRLAVELDFSPQGYAKVWLDDVLVSHAAVRAMSNQLAQAHFGLYAAPSIRAGEIRNDNLRITSGRCYG